jgi:hypothetical protein
MLAEAHDPVNELKYIVLALYAVFPSIYTYLWAHLYAAFPISYKYLWAHSI